LAGYVPFFYANPDLTWETTKEFNVGINLAFFKKRVEIEADYYDKKTTDFLMSVTLPALAGYNNGLNQQYQNTGAITNRGFELSLTTKNIDAKNFKWQTNFNISFNEGRIDKFYGNIRSIGSNWGLTGTAQAWIAETGGPLSQYYGYKADGLYQCADFDKLANGTFVLKNGTPTYAAAVQPGDQKYKDLNGDGIIDGNDQTTLGSYQPKHTGGITNNFTYKNFSLSVFGQWRYGGQIMNVNRVAFETTGSYFANGNQFASYANRWTPTNTDTDIPKARVNTKGDLSGNNPKPSSRFIEDGSFFRLKTVQINYNLPAAMLKRAKMSGASIFASAQNLYTWTNYSGLDPEVSSFRAQNSTNSPIQNTGNTAAGVGYSYIQSSAGTPVLTQGYDYTPYPRAITVTAGLNIVF
jgi:TonB-dependent starch-binding outer membrane protein SusC